MCFDYIPAESNIKGVFYTFDFDVWKSGDTAPFFTTLSIDQNTMQPPTRCI